jgi:hypothetical protein
MQFKNHVVYGIFLLFVVIGGCETISPAKSFTNISPAKTFTQIILDDKYYTSDKGRSCAQKYRVDFEQLVLKIRQRYPHTQLEFVDPSEGQNAGGICFAYSLDDPDKKTFLYIHLCTTEISENNFGQRIASVFSQFGRSLFDIAYANSNIMSDDNVYGICIVLQWLHKEYSFSNGTIESMNVWATKLVCDNFIKNKITIQEFLQQSKVYGMQGKRNLGRVKIDLNTPTQSTATCSYEIAVVDILGIPLQGATVTYQVENKTKENMTGTKNIVSITDSTGRISGTVETDPPEPSWTGITTDSNPIRINYAVSKENYYSKTGVLSCTFDNNPTKETVTLIRSLDYLKPDFVSSKEARDLEKELFSLINHLRDQSLLADSYLETLSITLTDFKEKRYLSLKINSTNVYNSLKLNKYDIGKILFDEVVRKTLDPLNDLLGKAEPLWGYDLIVIGQTKDFTDKYAIPKKIVYRFLITKTTVSRYKNKDISGQQVLNESIVLMDDERIELKLQ